jgi:phytoene synthase
MDLVRRHDPDRFFTALFAPPERRDALLLLYAFNHELARAREVTREGHMALIRLHWWREVVQGATRAHPIATPLAAALAAGTFAPADLLSIIDAREAEADERIETLADWRAYLRGTAGGLAVAAARLLGAPDPEATRDPGAAYGAAGVLRAVPALARQGRCLLPADVLATHALSPEAVVAGADPAPAIATLAAEGRALLRPLRLPRAAVAAVLPAVLARRDLARGNIARLLGPAHPRGIGDRLAVLLAAQRGRVGG